MLNALPTWYPQGRISLQLCVFLAERTLLRLSKDFRSFLLHVSHGVTTGIPCVGVMCSDKLRGQRVQGPSESHGSLQ